MGECLVCKVPCVGNHLGIMSCRACSSFFRRSVQLKRTYRCRYNEKCDVTFKNRYSCRYCRFQRCKKVGMTHEVTKVSPDTPSSSQTDSPALSDTINPEDRSWGGGKTADNEDFFSSFLGYAKDKVLEIFNQDHRFHIVSEAMPVSICQETVIAYRMHRRSAWPNTTPEKAMFMPVLDICLVLHHRYLSLEKVANFCASIQFFAALPTDQKLALFRHFWPRFEKLDRAYVSYKLLGDNPRDTRIVCLDGVITKWPYKISRIHEVSDMSEEDIRNVMKTTEDMFEKKFFTPFKRFKPDEFEMIALTLTVMFLVKGLPGVTEETIQLAKQIKDQIIQELHNYYVNTLQLPNYASRIYKMRNLIHALDKIGQMRGEDFQLFRTFNVFKKDIFLNPWKNKSEKYSGLPQFI